MGNSESKTITYAVSRNNADKKSNETSVFCHPKMAARSVFDINIDVKTIIDIYKKLFSSENENKNFFGFRPIKDNKREEFYSWKTAKEIHLETQELGSGFLNLKLASAEEEYQKHRVKVIGICSKNTVEYGCADIACTLYGITTVPIYDTFGEEAGSFIMEQTNIKTCVVTSQTFQFILKLKDNGKCASLQNFIVTDIENLSSELKHQAEGVIKVYSYNEVREEGRKAVKPWIEAFPESIWTICYTSGTCGQPKGVMVNHRNMIDLIPGVKEKVDLSNSDCHLSYLPMAHVLERVVFLGCAYYAVKIGFFSGDPQKISEDAEILQPTFFVSVPRLYVRIYEKIQENLGKLSPILSNFYQNALQTKLSNFRKNADTQHTIYDKIVFKKVKNILGGRVRFMVTGSAPIDKNVLEFLKVNFCCPILEGYGQTEGCGFQFATDVHDPDTGSVGGPFLNLEYKLVDVPEMNYLSTRKDAEGRPNPAGEIWVRGSSVSPGYFKNDEKNKETFTDDGWLLTGDIGQINGESAGLTIIDRKKNIFKLQQGEYIAPERLENIYKHSDALISEIFVYGDGLHSFLVAIVVVDSQEAKKCPDEKALKEKVLKILETATKEKKLNSLEKIKNVYIEKRSFGSLNLITSSFKLKRHEVGKFYQQVIINLYKEIEGK